MLTWTVPCARHQTTRRSLLHGDDSQQHQPTHTTMASNIQQRVPSWRHLPHGNRRALSSPAITAKEEKKELDQKRCTRAGRKVCTLLSAAVAMHLSRRIDFEALDVAARRLLPTKRDSVRVDIAVVDIAKTKECR